MRRHGAGTALARTKNVAGMRRYGACYAQARACYALARYSPICWHGPILLARAGTVQFSAFQGPGFYIFVPQACS